MHCARRSGDEASCLLLPNAHGVVDRLELARADRQMSLGGEGLVLMRLCRAPGTSCIEPGLLGTAFEITPAESRVMDKMDCERQADLIRKAAAFL